ncbi:Ground-like domain protein [Aphelenchoides besseyi]|nr:Ground-like domain protein [Aphelenchoides besseyi]KAI6201029.1 Ground-like domain protein [Aphelenchoides besseyi]
MEKVYEEKSKTRDGKWSKCNIQQVANGIQKAAQEKFGVDFETVAGTGDFASRILAQQNYGGGYAAAGQQKPAPVAEAYGGTPPPPAYGEQPTPAPQSGYDADQSEAQGAAAEEEPKGPGPLPECYINPDGFLCCNKELEQLMSDTYDKLSKSRDGKWKKCNRHQVSVAVQKAATEKFQHDFEVVTGAGDYASKNNFDSNLLCKIKRERSIILAYGTPHF